MIPLPLSRRGSIGKSRPPTALIAHGRGHQPSGYGCFRAVKGEPHRLIAGVVSRLRLVKRRHALSATLHARGAPLQRGAIMISGTFALAFAAAFTGASFYVNWVEQPARLKLDDQALLSEWGPSDSRGVSLLIALALLAAIAGFIAYFESQDVRWAFGALIIIASWLYAFFVMSPLDNQIRSLRGGEVAAARALVRQWGIVESGLTGIGVVAVLIFLWAH